MKLKSNLKVFFFFIIAKYLVRYVLITCSCPTLK